METITEQRRDTRTNLSWPVSIWLPDANRFFNGQSLNISRTGVFLSVSVTTPVRAGNMVELNFPRTMTLCSKRAVSQELSQAKWSELMQQYAQRCQYRRRCAVRIIFRATDNEKRGRKADGLNHQPFLFRKIRIVVKFFKTVFL